MTLAFAQPWLLLALAVLPALWWLLRVTPPPPRQTVFPPLRLLRDLPPTTHSAARTPPWLLALRILAAGLLIAGLAGPVWDAPPPLRGTGTLLVVLDDGWAAAADWGERVRAVDGRLAEAARGGRSVALLTTAPRSATAPLATGDAAGARAALAVLKPSPWPVDRAAAAAAVAAWHGTGEVLYLGDGLRDAGWPAFSRALSAVGPITRLDPGHAAASLMLPALPTAAGIVARVARPDTAAATMPVLAQAADGRTLARVDVSFSAGATVGRATLALPPEQRNRLTRLVLAEPVGAGLSAVAGAGAVALLDAGARRHDVALPDSLAAAASADVAAGQDAPLRGAGYFLRRALSPVAEVSGGPLAAALAKHPAMVLLPDRPVLPGSPDATALGDYVEGGGLLLRFAGPEMAAATADGARDPLLPVPLLVADRQLGGAMSWDRPQGIEPAPPTSPFAGLAIPDDVLITRQVLADPAADLAAATWLRLRDGTPLVTQRAIGAGRVVLVHVTANADWSNLPLSGLFIELLRRTLATSAATGPPGEATGDAPLVPRQTLDGFGQLGVPPAGVTAIMPATLGTLRAGPSHPPGFYGPEAARRALDLAANLPPPESSPPLPDERTQPMRDAAAGVALGPPLLGLAALLLALEGVLALHARGLLVRGAVAAMLLAACWPAHADPPPPAAALTSRLGYVRTGDAAVDEVSRAGLVGLSAYVRARTAATLDEPDGVTPGTDDLSLYPLLYWPVTPGAAPPGAPALTALNLFMAHGGILVIDTRDGGSGAGMADGAQAALRALAKPVDGVALNVPPLMEVSSQHVLARAFYLLRDYPGRYAGGPVWVARDEDRSNDGVSPIVIGGHDWAAAWAVDDQGQFPYATLPGGERQRTLAYRFGVNLVVYALTGNYKSDQVHIPQLLQRLGQ